MRILYTIMAYGPQIIASEVHSELGREFRAAGHSFAVLSLEDYGSGGEAGAAHFPGEAGVVPLYTLRFGNKSWQKFPRKLVSRLFRYAFFLELVFGLARFLRKHRREFDVIHVEAAYPLGAAWAIANRLSGSKIPFILNLQGADVMSLPAYDYGYARYRLPRLLLRYAFRKCAGVRANSEQTAELALNLGADPARVRVIYRNISDQIYPPDMVDIDENKAAQQQMLREKYNLKDGPVLIALSRLHPFKGLDFLVRAMPTLLEKWPDLNLLICGPARKTPQFGDYRVYLENIARELGVTDRVIFTGKVDFARSANYQAGADLLVVPSVVEALNKVVIEAAAVGTPAVITETTGIAFPAARDGVGLAVKAADAAALAEGITALLEDRARLGEMGRKGPEWARGFSSHEIAAKLLDFYRTVTAPVKGFVYVAYPSSLVLKSANAIQTFTTCRELRRLSPASLVLLPRLPGKPSRFEEIGAHHLLRWPFNVFNNLKPLRVIPWSYLERTFFAFEVGLTLLFRRLTGRKTRFIYVRDVICAYWLIKWWRPLLGAKVIYEAHDLEARNPSRARNPLLRRWLEKVDQTVMGRSDKLVSLTGAFRDFVVEEGLRPASSLAAVIPDAFDAEKYVPMSEAGRQSARAQLGFDPDEFLVVYSGLTFAYRSLDKLVEAFARFTRNRPDVKARLVFAGGRPFERAEVEAQAAKLGLSDRVQCVGQQPAEKVNLYLNAASLLAIPDTVTDVTASPLKLFEYAAVARPVMLPDLPALKEILPEGQAVYFPRGSVDGMLEALEYTYSQPQEAATRAQAAYKSVSQYTYTNRARSILDLLD